jgi:hypothetical protein
VRRVLLGAATAALLAWLAWGTLSLYPHYLAYFNELAGGPDGGWRVLVDSNLDWGQDLKGLKRWADLNVPEGERLKLAYLGEAYPTYYGLDFDPLPSWPDRWQHPLYHDHYPYDPAPGLYAISANLLQGRNLADPETYAWFRDRTPIDKVGYSIFVYEVPARRHAGPAVLALSGVDLADVRPEEYARLETNDVRVLWFDARRAWLDPDGGGATAFYVSDETPLHPVLAGLAPRAGEGESPCAPATTRSGRPYCIRTADPRLVVADEVSGIRARAGAVAADAAVWHLPAASFTPGDPEDHGERLAYPVRFGDTMELLGYELLPAAQARVSGHGGGGPERALHPGEALTLVTYWRVREPPQAPLKLFLHLLDAQSGYVTGEDRLDVWYDNWQPGDLFAQVHEVALPAEIPPGRYQVEVGAYDPATMLRLPVTRDGAAIADRVLLAPIEVGGRSGE